MQFFVFVFTQWQLQGEGSRFTVIASKDISLYVGKDTYQTSPHIIPSDTEMAEKPQSESAPQSVSQSKTTDFIISAQMLTLYKVSGFVAH